MPWSFLVYLLAFCLHCILLGVNLFTLMQVADLENDYINPHDFAASINRLVVPEYVLQGALSALLLFSGNWVLGVAHAALTASHLQQLSHRKHLADVTEVFRQVKTRKKHALIKLGVYLVAFVWVIYRMVEVIIVSFLTPDGRKAAKDLLIEAAASLQR